MSAPDPFGIALHLVLVKYLSDRLAEVRRDDLGPKATEALPETMRVPVMLGGRAAGTVSMPRPSVRVSVTNAAKFRAWVEEHRPGEIEVIRSVRPSFAEAVRKSVREHGGWLDKTSGEVTPVPGVEASAGDPSVRVELADDAGEVIGAAYRAGLLDLGSVLALPSGDGDAT